MCRSTFPSRRAITAKLAARPCAKSSIHWWALAIAIRSASRRLALIGVLCAGTWMMPLTAAGAGLVQGTAIVVTLGVGRPAEVFAGLWACAGSLIWRGRSARWFGVSVTRSRWRSRRSARAQMAAQRRHDERLDLGGGNAADQSGRLRLLLQHSLGDVIAVAGAALVGVGWAHAVAAIVKKAPAQERGR